MVSDVLAASVRSMFEAIVVVATVSSFGLVLGAGYARQWKLAASSLACLVGLMLIADALFGLT